MGDVELLNPRGLWLLTGVVPLVVLYILKIKRQRMRVASTWLWAEARRDLLAKSPFKRLVPELALLLQLLALLTLAAALSRPARRGGRIDGDHVAIVIDTSASMGAAATGKDGAQTTRIALARAAATDVVDAMQPGADAIVIEAAREATVIAPLDRDVRKIKAAVASLTAREVEGDLSSAVALAADRLRSVGGRRRIVIVTDGALAHDAPLEAAGLDTQVEAVGDPRDNAAIVRIDLRAGTEGPSRREQAQVFVMLENYADTPRDAYVTLTLEGSGEPRASRRVLIPPHEKAPVVLTFAPEPGEYGKGLVVELSPHDALAADDRAFARVPRGRKMPVTVASKAEYSWLMRALEADDDVDLQRLSLAQLAEVNVDPDALVVIEGACPATGKGRDRLIVGPPEGTCLGVGVGKPTVQPQLTSWESGDARLRFLTLDGVHLTRATPLEAAGAGGSLVRAGTITVAADASSPGRAATIIGFDVGESDWPMQASFVLFIRNIVETARVHRAQGSVGPVRTGDALRITVPPEVDKLTIEGPGLSERELSARGGFAIVPAVDRAGLYRAKWTLPQIGGELVAANLTSDRESDIRPKNMTVGSGGGSQVTAGRMKDAHHEWAAWLALAATALIAADLIWLTRKPKAAAQAPRDTKARA